jgi:hypothetical protein
MPAHPGELRQRRLELISVGANSQIMLQSDYGNIGVADVNAQSLTITANSGRIDLADLEISADLKANSDYGNLDLEQVTAGSSDLKPAAVPSLSKGQRDDQAHSGYGYIKVTGGGTPRSPQPIAVQLNTAAFWAKARTRSIRLWQPYHHHSRRYRPRR